MGLTMGDVCSHWRFESSSNLRNREHLFVSPLTSVIFGLNFSLFGVSEIRREHFFCLGELLDIEMDILGVDFLKE